MDKNIETLLRLYEIAIIHYKPGNSSRFRNNGVAACSWIAEEIYGELKQQDKIELIRQEIDLELLKQNYYNKNK